MPPPPRAPVRLRWIAVGAALVGGPLAAGQAWAYYDYWVTREVLAREIIDGLQRYAGREATAADAARSRELARQLRSR